MHIAEQNLEYLFRNLEYCYDRYLRKSDINPDHHFYLDKIYEELGELVTLELSRRGFKPGPAPDKLEDRINEEAADLFCQVIVLIIKHKYDIWPKLNEKWLKELSVGEGGY